MNTTTNKAKETAIENYENHLAAIMEKLDRVRNTMTAEHDNGKPKNWGHAGSAGHVSELLDNILEFIGG